MSRRQRSPFGELVYAQRTARNLTQAALAAELEAAMTHSGIGGTISLRTIANIERRYQPDEPWSFNQQATVDILAEFFGHAEGSPGWNEFQAAAHATRTIAVATRSQTDSTTFVEAGREAQLARVDNALDQVARGQNGVLLLSAEGGAGKTAMLLHACRRALERHPEMVVLWGESSSQHHPYQPFASMTSASLGLQEHAAAEHLVSAHNRLRLQERLPVALANLAADGQVFVDRFVAIDNVDFDRLPSPLVTTLAGRESAGRVPTDEQEFFDQSWQALTHYAGPGPVVLVFDNLHLADEETVTLLLDKVRRLHDSTSPILILGAYRPFDLMPTSEAPAPPFARVLPEIRRYAYDPVVNLRTAIGGKAGRSYIEALIASRVQDAPGSLVDDMMNLTDGLPLFVEAALRWYQQGAVLQRVTPDDPLHWDGTKGVLPSEIDEVFRDLFNRLPELHQTMLQAASMQGAIFSADVLQRVLGMDRTTLIEELVEFLGRGATLVEPAGTRIIANRKSYDYRFFHSQMGDFIHRLSDEEQRRSLHRATADAMIEIWGVETHNGAQLIAKQLELGGDKVAAGRWYLRAGDFHLFRHEHRQSAPFFQRIVDLGQVHLDPFAVAQAQVGLGNCARGLGDLPLAERFLTQAGETARLHGAPLAEANALTSHGMVDFDLGHMNGAADKLQRAIAILQILGNKVEVCRSLSLFSHARLALGFLDDAREAADQSIAMAASLGDDGLYVQGLVAKTEYLLHMGQTDQAIDLARRGFEIAEEHGDSHRMALSAINLIDGLLEANRPDEARQVYERISTLRQVINGRMIGSTLFEHGMILLHDGRLDDAEQAIRDSLAVRRRHHQHALAVSNQVALLRIAIERLDHTAVRGLAQDVHAAIVTQGTDGLEWPIQIYLALIDAGELLGDDEMVSEATRAGQDLILERAARIARDEDREQYVHGRRPRRLVLARAQQSTGAMG